LPYFTLFGLFYYPTVYFFVELDFPITGMIYDFSTGSINTWCPVFGLLCLVLGLN
jgi:hypothetical protein